MNIEQMKYFKKAKGYTFAQLSEDSGVPIGTLQKIFNGETHSPRYDTLMAIEKVLKPDTDVDRICEALTEYGVAKKECTIDDYYALPDERRVELIDGVFYDMAAPSLSHQIISMRLSVLISNYISKKKGNCIVFAAPVDVQLDCDNRTMVQPDIVVLCDRDKMIDRCIMGAPDFVVEILSPSTREKDVFLKTAKYRNAGVREYWMVDLKKERVITYYFEDDEIPAIYGLDAVIPVRMYDGELEIDFAEVKEDLAKIH